MSLARVSDLGYSCRSNSWILSVSFFEGWFFSAASSSRFAAGRSPRCINALTPIDSGFIVVDGIEVNDSKLDKLALRRKVGIVFQSYNLFPHKTALENVMLPQMIRGLERAEASPDPDPATLLNGVYATLADVETPHHK